MTKSLISLTAALALALPASAQEQPNLQSSSEVVTQSSEPAPSPNQIVAEAGGSEWIAIPAEDLLVMTLAPDAEGDAREVVIQLMPAPFSQGWVENIRTLARAGWYDGISVNRVQDNYVVQWGDPNYDNPEASGEAKPLPQSLNTVPETAYTVDGDAIALSVKLADSERDLALEHGDALAGTDETTGIILANGLVDSYSQAALFGNGWPLSTNAGDAAEGEPAAVWPVHCYGMVGVGRGMSPDTGSGAELYTVIGHAPRHLDRNIALVGRIVEGMEHLSSLPRGTGDLGFYTTEEADKRTPILSIRVASDLPEADPASSSEAVGQDTRPAFEYLSTEGETFARYADARANRRDPFFIVPAGGADICNIPVPVRRVGG
ncbi:peptidylprolyl isomerase [Qipengyuania sp. XHP0207]|uniref:peptidylprolyl isomerase n=1 Tax=Qipengyuania sp. XHP0207 TaxID=3038078 RepID=UPI00241E3F50|nr:peptidylprolyl isomerase [Qipengyuania sp. XHP0207]MDG5749306.1 peptidylprolyl isomerase [Qipengyuania sp. XHP0207]